MVSALGEERIQQPKNKYSGIFSRQMEAIEYASNIFRNTCDFENRRISLGYSPVLAREYSVT